MTPHEHAGSARSDAEVLAALNELSSRLWQLRSLAKGLGEMLDATLSLVGADKGVVQLLDAERSGALAVAAQSGLDPELLGRLRETSAANDSPGARALRSRACVVIEDTEADGAFAHHRAIARACSCRALPAAPLLGRDGRALGVVSIYFASPHRPGTDDLRRLDLYLRQASDFVERLSMDEALRESDERFARFMHFLPGLAWIKDGAGRYVYANDAAAHAFQTPRERLYGRTDEEVFPSETAQQFREHDRRALAAATGIQVIETLDHGDGVLRHSLVSKFPMPSADGRAPFAGRDGHRHHRAHARRGGAARERGAPPGGEPAQGRFLATLAHELRNPLAPLRNGLELMRLAKDDAEAIERVRGMMERQLGQMVRLIDDLLDVSRISRGKVTLRKQRVPLGEVVRQAVETVRPMIEQAGLALAISVPSEPVHVEGDAARLAQVFSNLLSNAAKFTPGGGDVRLEIRSARDEAVVSVRDSGIGIPARMLGRVFEMFTQVDDSLERAQGGLGIGLSLVKGLVEMHGGSVDACSEGEGRGSEFVVRLPLARATAQHGGAALAEPARDGRQRRVLVADDNRDAALTLAMIFEALGHETQVAHDGVEALAAAEALRPDVILLDIGMPKLNGYDVARRLREQPWGRLLRLVAVTGWGQEEDRRRSREAGFDLHAVKPIDPALIEKMLDSLGEGAQREADG